MARRRNPAVGVRVMGGTLRIGHLGKVHASKGGIRTLCGSEKMVGITPHHADAKVVTCSRCIKILAKIEGVPRPTEKAGAWTMAATKALKGKPVKTRIAANPRRRF